MTLTRDIKGIESLPMRLIIVAVVVSMSVVPAARALESFQDREFVMRLSTRAQMIVATAQILTIEGPGSVRTLDVDLSGGGSIRFVSITIGDGAGGPNSSSVVVRLSTGASIVRKASDPPVLLTGPTSTGLVIDTPRFELRLSAQMLGSGVMVTAEVV